MLLGLHRSSNSLDQESNHPQTSHYHRPDIYPTDFTSSNLNQVPIIPCLFDSQPLMSYDFQEPNQLLINRLPSQISRASSLSCHSSSSSNRSQLNLHHQMSAANYDCHSPTLLHQSYLTASIDFIQSLTPPKNSLFGYPSREVRSESIGSDQNANWKMATILNNPESSFDSIPWTDQSLQSRTPVSLWTTDSNNMDGGSPFDHTSSIFALRTYPTEGSLSDQLASNFTPEGPVMAEFPLPPDVSDDNSNIVAPKRPRVHRSETQTILEAGTALASATASKKAKKSTPRSTRTNNNGGRCRRLAPANRECPHCGDKFTRNDRLHYHIDSIHEQKERKHKCIQCSKAFRQRCDLQRHMRHVHKFSIKEN